MPWTLHWGAPSRPHPSTQEEESAILHGCAQLRRAMVRRGLSLSSSGHSPQDGILGPQRFWSLGLCGSAGPRSPQPRILKHCPACPLCLHGARAQELLCSDPPGSL